ncbi:hypothetical protein [Streptomyces sp. SID12501]|uniref:Integral membrane protein n=1 Tax=Streptomyces sp. SID12501 TaxID=2706042 RepID=A0A6B3C754_9ACTN|nr:hypothetical protein [Streptomyces sp. SID12501]NEC92152.1 hypothetical protein [Streptomyces sp. SID12501]
MSNRHARKMLRQMASGEPVEVTNAMATVKKFAQLSFIARQFGYKYADVRQGGRPRGNGLVLLIVPDPSPQAQALAEQNRARYPQAGDGGTLPPLVPDEVELLKTCIDLDLAARYTEKQLMVLTSVSFSTSAVGIAFHLGTDTNALVASGIIWVALIACVPVVLVINRRHRARQVARLKAAGFTAVTEQSGRIRYVPPDGRLPGNGNPFAGGA